MILIRLKAGFSITFHGAARVVMSKFEKKLGLYILLKEHMKNQPSTKIQFCVLITYEKFSLYDDGNDLFEKHNISFNNAIPQTVVKLKMKSIVQVHMHESVEKLDTLDVFDEHGRPIG